MSRSEEYIEQQATQAISANEIKRAAKRIRVGDTFRMLNMSLMKSDCETFGKVVKTKVKHLFPHIVLFENGKSARYCDIAMYYRHGKKGVLR